MDKSILTEKLYDHCLGSGDPTLDLVSSGIVSTKWVENYLLLLSEASSTWSEESLVPRKVVAAVHYASFYLNIRYDIWCQNSGCTNRETEKLIGSLRTPSEIFILNVQNA